MRLLIILRGLPGSGKSYLANKLYEHYISYIGKDNRPLYTVGIFSADPFWKKMLLTPPDSYDSKSIYDFKPQYIDLAHKFCQGETAKALFDDLNVVIIDNTNITLEEMQPYLELAARFSYDVEIQQPQTSWAKDVQECHKRNTHGVPLEIIEKMATRWQNFKVTTERVI